MQHQHQGSEQTVTHGSEQHSMQHQHQGSEQPATHGSQQRGMHHQHQGSEQVVNCGSNQHSMQHPQLQSDVLAELQSAAMQQSGQHMHWMPVFCQMGNYSGFPGTVPNSPYMPWGNSPSPGPFLPGAVPNSPPGPWGQGVSNMPWPGGPQGGSTPYPWPGQESLPRAATAATAAADAATAAGGEVSVQDRTAASKPEAQPGHTAVTQTADPKAADAGNMPQSTEQAMPLDSSNASSSTKAALNTADGVRMINDSQSQAVLTRDTSAVQARIKSLNQAVGIAACLPKLDKQLSQRSSEELTARAVAKLWGVNLKRYTGRKS